MHRIGEDVAERLDVIPAQFRVIVTRRPKYGCRACEGAVVQAAAPARLIARGRAGPNLLALVMVSKYGRHLPLTPQSAIYAREGVEIDVSTLADWVGAVAATAMPLVEAIRAHVFAAERLHADDTTVPAQAKEKTRIARLDLYPR
jgi:transposase